MAHFLIQVLKSIMDHLFGVFNDFSVQLFYSFIFTLFCQADLFLMFLGDGELDLYKNILKNDLIIPDYFSGSLKSFIKKVLEKDPSKRISMSQVVDHPWLNN